MKLVIVTGILAEFLAKFMALDIGLTDQMA